MIRQHYRRSLLFIFMAAWIIQPITAYGQDENREYKRLAQLTFVSPIGSNGFLSPEITNNFSLNILTGVSGGVNGFELGGLHNTTKGDVTGVQVAGLGNVTTGIYSGFQLAGLYNVDGNLARGMLVAGITNVVSGPSKGFHLAGITNITRDECWSFQVSGISNVSVEGNHGLQIAGINNFSGGEGESVQLSGLVNVHLGDRNKFQIAGLVNISASETKGVQIAGIANYTKKLAGFQLALINIADTVARGVPLGLISIIRHGYFAFEVEANEAFWINATYKMGVPRLYNIFTVGFNKQNKQEMWAVGLGLGSIVPIGDGWGLNFDLTASHINENEWWTEELNLLNRLKINAWFDLGPVQLFGGPSINVHVSNLTDDEGLPGGNLVDPDLSFYNGIHGKTRTIVYPGVNFGLRF